MTLPVEQAIELLATPEVRRALDPRSDLRAAAADAYSILTSGLPGANEPYETGTGELDNGHLRSLLASSICEVLLRDPAAHERLSRFLNEQSSWFERKRAELIVTLQGYQRGELDSSTWLSGYRRVLAPTARR
jgi:hypothetical protein